MSAVVEKFVKEAENELASVEDEIKSKVADLVDKRDELVTILKKLKKGSKAPNAAPTTSDEDLVAAVAHVSKSGPAKSPDIAKFLGVDPRTISRRLSAFAQDPEKAVSGNKDDGYTV